VVNHEENGFGPGFSVWAFVNTTLVLSPFRARLRAQAIRKAEGKKTKIALWFGKGGVDEADASILERGYVSYC
jgi:hypothetical protein